MLPITTLHAANQPASQLPRLLLLSGELEVGAAYSLAVQLGAVEPHHVPHSDGTLHGARLALPLRLPSPGQCYTCSQG